MENIHFSPKIELGSQLPTHFVHFFVPWKKKNLQPLSRPLVARQESKMVEGAVCGYKKAGWDSQVLFLLK